jgi:exodeoxyribonuclease VII small subunit
MSIHTDRERNPHASGARSFKKDLTSCQVLVYSHEWILSYGVGVAQLKFEEALSRLEEAVKLLEKGDLPLEDSLKIFEDGIRSSKNCLKVLEEAEKKVEVLIQDKKGKKHLRPLDPVENHPAEGTASNE